MKWIPRIFGLVALWGAVGATIMYIEPSLLRDVVIPGSYLPFFVLVTAAVWYSLALMTKSGLKSLWLSLTIVGGLVLSMLKLMHWGLMIALLLTLVIESWYIYHKS